MADRDDAGFSIGEMAALADATRWHQPSTWVLTATRGPCVGATGLVQVQCACGWSTATEENEDTVDAAFVEHLRDAQTYARLGAAWAEAEATAAAGD